jgi:hypothetical protein
MVEAHIDVFLATDSQGQFTQQQVTAIGMNLKCAVTARAAFPINRDGNRRNVP